MNLIDFSLLDFNFSKFFVLGYMVLTFCTKEVNSINSDFETNLVLMIVNTNGSLINSKDDWVDAAVKIIDRSPTQMNKLNDSTSNCQKCYDGSARIKLRGHSALQFPKKSYTLDLSNSFGVAGFPEAEKWVLYGSGGYQGFFIWIFISFILFCFYFIFLYFIYPFRSVLFKKLFII
jgi:hypothetical protein